ncbi:outer membrane protein [Marinospirillum alkaliphilum]|uniref:Opacity protein n=1 Tax=Marinospirillum alkaliphilum DSM 21637 TaxID=1122209 RepID=A0A1K1W6G6_9GAMM|nr:outer membrane beta-barrel protein [Marinospirillum alkaliphilum]SFX32791.1 Opacity protein [Marinospirillum alkaliphilum DSM 21637]
MKKQLMAVAVTGLMSWGVAGASSFDGAYAGVSLASFSIDSEVKLTDFSQPEDNATTKSKAGSATALGLLVGYGRTFGQFYLGGEFQYRSKLGVATGKEENHPEWSNFVKVKTELGQSYALAIIPGYLVMDNLLVYGRLTYGLTEAESQWEGSDGGGDYARYSYAGALQTMGAGLGVDYAVLDQLRIRAELQSVRASGFDVLDAWDAAGNIGRKVETDKIVATGFELSLLYRF